MSIEITSEESIPTEINPTENLIFQVQKMFYLSVLMPLLTLYSTMKLTHSFSDLELQAMKETLRNSESETTEILIDIICLILLALELWVGF